MKSNVNANKIIMEMEKVDDKENTDTMVEPKEASLEKDVKDANKCDKELTADGNDDVAPKPDQEDLEPVKIEKKEEAKDESTNPPPSSRSSSNNNSDDSMDGQNSNAEEKNKNKNNSPPSDADDSFESRSSSDYDESSHEDNDDEEHADLIPLLKPQLKKSEPNDVVEIDDSDDNEEEEDDDEIEDYQTKSKKHKPNISSNEESEIDSEAGDELDENGLVNLNKTNKTDTTDDEVEDDDTNDYSEGDDEDDYDDYNNEEYFARKTAEQAAFMQSLKASFVKEKAEQNFPENQNEKIENPDEQNFAAFKPNNFESTISSNIKNHQAEETHTANAFFKKRPSLEGEKQNLLIADVKSIQPISNHGSTVNQYNASPLDNNLTPLKQSSDGFHNNMLPAGSDKNYQVLTSYKEIPEKSTTPEGVYKKVEEAAFNTKSGGDHFASMQNNKRFNVHKLSASPKEALEEEPSSKRFKGETNHSHPFANNKPNTLAKPYEGPVIDLEDSDEDMYDDEDDEEPEEEDNFEDPEDEHLHDSSDYDESTVEEDEEKDKSSPLKNDPVKENNYDEPAEEPKTSAEVKALGDMSTFELKDILQKLGVPIKASEQTAASASKEEDPNENKDEREDFGQMEVEDLRSFNEIAVQTDACDGFDETDEDLDEEAIEEYEITIKKILKPEFQSNRNQNQNSVSAPKPKAIEMVGEGRFKSSSCQTEGNITVAQFVLSRECCHVCDRNYLFSSNYRMTLEEAGSSPKTRSKSDDPIIARAAEVLTKHSSCHKCDEDFKRKMALLNANKSTNRSEQKYLINGNIGNLEDASSSVLSEASSSKRKTSQINYVDDEPNSSAFPMHSYSRYINSRQESDAEEAAALDYMNARNEDIRHRYMTNYANRNSFDQFENSLIDMNDAPFLSRRRRPAYYTSQRYAPYARHRPARRHSKAKKSQLRAMFAELLRNQSYLNSLIGSPSSSASESETDEIADPMDTDDNEEERVPNHSRVMEEESSELTVNENALDLIKDLRLGIHYQKKGQKGSCVLKLNSSDVVNHIIALSFEYPQYNKFQLAEVYLKRNNIYNKMQKQFILDEYQVK